MKKDSPKVPTQAEKTLKHVKEFAKSDIPPWALLLGVGAGLYAITRLVSAFVKDAGAGSDQPNTNKLSAAESVERAKSNPAKAGAGPNGEHPNDLPYSEDASDEQLARAINNNSGPA